MDMGNHDGDMSMQYGTIHETAAKLKLLGSSGNGTSLTVVEDTRPVKQQAQQGAVRYRECLKNHAASIGGHAVDGCGEFLPCGEEGTLESLKCAACDCHRNFHRREVEGEPSCDCQQMKRKDKKRSISMMMGGGGGRLMGGESDQEGAYMAGGGGGSDGAAGSAMMLMKKRFRTKFSTEQKDKMLNFAEKLGWKIQKHDEADVQQFCSECGIKRQVLKVWMHNNKHTLGKKLEEEYTEGSNLLLQLRQW